MSAEQLALGLGPRLKPSAERVWAMLKNAGPHGVTTGEFLASYLASYSQRCGELKRAGVRIEKERVSPGQWRYWLSESTQELPGAALPAGRDMA